MYLRTQSCLRFYRFSILTEEDTWSNGRAGARLEKGGERGSFGEERKWESSCTQGCAVGFHHTLGAWGNPLLASPLHFKWGFCLLIFTTSRNSVFISSLWSDKVVGGWFTWTNLRRHRCVKVTSVTDRVMAAAASARPGPPGRGQPRRRVSPWAG